MPGLLRRLADRFPLFRGQCRARGAGHPADAGSAFPRLGGTLLTRQRGLIQVLGRLTALLCVLFGQGWAPCLGATLAAVLTRTVTSGSAVPRVHLQARHRRAVPVPIAGVRQGMRAFSFARRRAAVVTRASGAMLVSVGVLQVACAVKTWLRNHRIGGYELPL